jgi:hypothetical protein
MMDMVTDALQRRSLYTSLRAHTSKPCSFLQIFGSKPALPLCQTRHFIPVGRSAGARPAWLQLLVTRQFAAQLLHSVAHQAHDARIVLALPHRLVGGKPPIPPRERGASVNFASQSCANNRGRGCGGRSPPGAQPPYLVAVVFVVHLRNHYSDALEKSS